MNKIKNNVAYVLKSIKKDRTLKPVVENLKGRTYIISGGSRGIGYNIAKKLALQGANVTITGKTEVAHPKLEGTIYSAEEKIVELTQRPTCMAVPCDIRNPNDIDLAVSETLDVYGRIDGVILNASALCLNSTLNQTQKEIDLMTSVNIKGSFLMGKKI